MTNEPGTPGTPQGSGPDAADHLQDRMEAFGREAQATGERFGRQAQAAGERLARDPAFISLGTWMTRLWGLVLVGVGLWFLADTSLGLAMPRVDWSLVWPLALIVVGGGVILSALARRR
jgi:hypothetical protein